MACTLVLVSDDPVQVAGIEPKLRRELSPGHPLFGMPVKTLARRRDCDDVFSPSRMEPGGWQWFI